MSATLASQPTERRTPARANISRTTARPAGQPPLLLTCRQAAAVLAMSLSHFERHVQPHVPCVLSGQLGLYRPEDLRRWADLHVTPRAGA